MYESARPCSSHVVLATYILLLVAIRAREACDDGRITLAQYDNILTRKRESLGKITIERAATDILNDLPDSMFARA